MKPESGGATANPGGVLNVLGGRCVLAFDECAHASISIRGEIIERIAVGPVAHLSPEPENSTVDLRGFLVLPGLVNAHDHLEFALYPRLGIPPYRNYVEWGEDIHSKFADMIVWQKRVPHDARLWWGGIRNLLCGATTVCHHNPLWPELTRVDFPVRVVKEYGWAHSIALGGDLVAARAATPPGRAFIVHAGEGVDRFAQDELRQLDMLGVLDEFAVLVHGLGMDETEIALLNKRGASLIACPSSNEFLFGRSPDKYRLKSVERVALGSDSPLTAKGDLLDEIRFAMDSCGIEARTAFEMVTKIPASILHLNNGEGSIKQAGYADLIAIPDNGASIAERLQKLSMEDVEFVMIGGQVRLASETLLERLPAHLVYGLEPLAIDGMIRWLRAPIAELFRNTAETWGGDRVRLGSRGVTSPALVEAGYAR